MLFYSQTCFYIKANNPSNVNYSLVSSSWSMQGGMQLPAQGMHALVISLHTLPAQSNYPFTPTIKHIGVVKNMDNATTYDKSTSKLWFIFTRTLPPIRIK